MNQKRKKQIAILLVCCMLFTLLPTMAFAEDTIIDSGTCGDNLTWTLDSNGTLTITGSGLMIDFPEWGGHKSDIQKVIIGDDVTSIGKNAFKDCSGLTSIKISDSVTTIGSYAFYSCSGLTSIEIPNSVKSIESQAFENCSGLRSIKVPNSVTMISAGTFNNCSGLTSVEIPEGVTTIGIAAFLSCIGLTSIEIPSSVTTIGNYAFKDCTNLTHVIYDGTEVQWENITIGEYNDILKAAHRCSTPGTYTWQSGNKAFWQACSCGYTTDSITVTTSSGLVYNGQPQKLLASENELFVYSLEENEGYSAEIPTGINAGDYTVWFNIKDQSTTPQNVTVSIAKATSGGGGGYYAPEAETNKANKTEETTWNNPFIDVSETDWYYHAVQYAHQNKLFAGMSTTEFAPNMPMSRGMLVTVLYRMAGSPAVTGDMPFIDVNTILF